MGKMGPYSYFPLLLIIITCHSGDGRKSYEVINFKIPQAVWQKALNPTPVLKSSVTVTIPIEVQDEADDPVDDEVSESDIDTADTDIVPESDIDAVDTDVVPEPEVPVPPASSPTSPAVITQSPLLQDEIVSETPVTGQAIKLPCECRKGECGCCTGAFMERFKMKSCGNITFIPEDFVFDVKLNVNNKTVVRRRVSASDPPPICFNPRRAPFVQICAEISNIQIRNRNAHACFDINANIADFPVYSASFRCFSLGASGVKTGQKPRPVSSTGPKPVNLFGNSNSNVDDSGGGGFLQNALGTVFGDGGFFQGGGQGGGGGSSDDDGPFDGFGDALGDFLDFE